MEKKIGIAIELKHAEDASFDAACREAPRQIEERDYAEALLGAG